MHLRIVFQAAFQEGFFKHLRDVAAVLLDLICLSLCFLFLHVIPDGLDDDQIRSLCGALAENISGLLQLTARCLEM